MKAVEVASLNAKRHQLRGKINLFAGDWFFPLNRRYSAFDMIISNPPYIKFGQINQLQPEIFAFEPISALDGGKDGLCCLKHIIESAHHYLNPGGMLILEIGYDQQSDARKIAEKCDQYEHFQCTKDYSGYDRVVQMRKKMLRTDI